MWGQSCGFSVGTQSNIWQGLVVGIKWKDGKIEINQVISSKSILAVRRSIFTCHYGLPMLDVVINPVFEDFLQKYDIIYYEVMELEEKVLIPFSQARSQLVSSEPISIVLYESKKSNDEKTTILLFLDQQRRQHSSTGSTVYHRCTTISSDNSKKCWWWRQQKRYVFSSC